jgi:hypothetical protein
LGEYDISSSLSSQSEEDDNDHITGAPIDFKRTSHDSWTGLLKKEEQLMELIEKTLLGEGKVVVASLLV